MALVVAEDAGPAEGERAGDGADALTGEDANAVFASAEQADASTAAAALTAAAADSCSEAMVFESAASLAQAIPTPVQSHRAPT